MANFAFHSGSAVLVVALVLCVLSGAAQAFGHYSMMDSLIDRRLGQLLSPAFSPSWYHPMADFNLLASPFHHGSYHPYHPYHRHHRGNRRNDHRGVVDPYFHYLQHQMAQPTRTFDRVLDSIMEMMDAVGFVEPRELSGKSPERTMSISEDNTKYKVQLGVPDAQREDIRLSVRGNELAIQAEHRTKTTKPIAQAVAAPSEEAGNKAVQTMALPQDQNVGGSCVQRTEEGLEIIEDGCVVNSSSPPAVVQPVEATPVVLDSSPSSVASEADVESYWRMDRRLQLPDDVDGSKIEASFKDGVLTVVLPKKAPAAELEHQILIQ